MCFGVPGVPRCFIFFVKFDTKHDFNCTWYRAMRANDNVGTILAHPDKGRLWGGTEWPCSGGSLRHPASNVLFFSPRICTWSLVSESLWSTAPKWCYEIHLMLLHIYPSQVGFAVSPKRRTTQIFTRLQFGRMMRNQWIWGLPWFAGIPPFSHTVMCRQAYLQCDGPQHGRLHLLKELKQQQVTLAPGCNPAGSHCTRFLGTMKCQQTAEGFLGFGVFLLSPLAALHIHTHKSTWHAFCVAWPAREFAQMLQQQGWQINIQNNLLVLCVVDRFGCILGQHFALAGNTLDIHWLTQRVDSKFMAMGWMARQFVHPKCSACALRWH